MFCFVLFNRIVAHFLRKSASDVTERIKRYLSVNYVQIFSLIKFDVVINSKLLTISWLILIGQGNYWSFS